MVLSHLHFAAVSFYLTYLAREKYLEIVVDERKVEDDLLLLGILEFKYQINKGSNP